MITDNDIADGFFWHNRPEFEVRDGRLHIFTSPDTDFWQTTHYGFRRDNGHCLLTSVDRDFSLTVRTDFFPKKQYDQCGLILRLDSGNWIKTSAEYETETHSRLGSVVTNLGFSDWATIDIDSSVKSMWYRIQTKGKLYRSLCTIQIFIHDGDGRTGQGFRNRFGAGIHLKSKGKHNQHQHDGVTPQAPQFFHAQAVNVPQSLHQSTLLLFQ